jgi:hypothetical protein
MPKRPEGSDDSYADKEAEERYRKAIGGAFKTPPQPMDELPKKRGGVQKKAAAPKGRRPSSTSSS